MKKMLRKRKTEKNMRYGYLEHPNYEKHGKIQYDGICKCKYPLDELYPNICFRCMKLKKINSTKEERKCKHNHISTIGEEGFRGGCPTDPYCLDCHKTVALFRKERVLWQDLG